MSFDEMDFSDIPLDFPEDRTDSAVRELQKAIETNDSLVVVCHDNPDPDCLSSALALQEIASTMGINTIEIAYGGELTSSRA